LTELLDDRSGKKTMMAGNTANFPYSLGPKEEVQTNALVHPGPPHII